MEKRWVRKWEILCRKIIIIGKDCAEHMRVRCSKRWINIASVDEVHVMLPHASVKKGISVLRNAQASGPHVVMV